MKIEPLRSGSFRIWLTATDMERWGLQFEELSANHAPTRAAVAKLLSVAGHRAPLSAESVTVEAIPVESGCVLLFTPRRRLPLPRMPLPQIFALETANDLLALGNCLQGESELPAASLYAWGDAYRLILYSGIGTPYKIRARLSEYAAAVGEGSCAAAFTEEHGTPLIIGNALQLISRESPPPAPPHRAR